MNYNRIYNQLIDNAKQRNWTRKTAPEYVEQHHIIPRSLKGSDLKENTVYMPATDHFKCHQLLTEMTEGADKGKMWNGLWRMMNKQSRNQDRDFTFNPEDYKTARINSAKAHS